MEPIDDRPLDREPLSGGPPPTTRRAGLSPVVIIAAIGLVLGAAAAWWWTRDTTTPVAETVADTAPEAPVPVPEPKTELPPVGQMDTFLRSLLGTLSSHPQMVRWLATDDLVRQMARGIDRVSRGQTPAPNLAVLRPQGEFTTAGDRRARTVDPASYRRYESLTGMVESLDAKGVAEAYRTIHPRLDEAYRSLGRADTGVHQAVLIALQQLIDTPVPEGTVSLVPGKGATYAYANPRLEGLTHAQKQLVRMGPDNMRRIQARLREIKAAIEAAPPA